MPRPRDRPESGAVQPAFPATRSGSLVLAGKPRPTKLPERRIEWWEMQLKVGERTRGRRTKPGAA
jgi:hypothetical protein